MRKELANRLNDLKNRYDDAVEELEGQDLSGEDFRSLIELMDMVGGSFDTVRKATQKVEAARAEEVVHNLLDAVEEKVEELEELAHE